MVHREVTVTLCGVVLGVIIGAGSLAAVGDSSMARVTDPTADVRFHEAPKARDYRVRDVNKKAIPFRNDTSTNPYSRVKDGSETGGHEAAPAELQGCEAAHAAVNKLRKAFDSLVPRNIGNTALRTAMAAAFADAMDDCAVSVEEGAGASSSAAAVSGVDNDCEKYSKRTPRYTQCVFAQMQGRVYTGK